MQNMYVTIFHMPDIFLEKLPSLVSAHQQEALLVHAKDG